MKPDHTSGVVSVGRVVAIFCVFLIGCVTLPKPLYFGLDMGTPPEERPARLLQTDRLLEVDIIRVTDKLVRRDVLIQKHATEYEYYYEAKWVARLPELVAEKLAVEFTPEDWAERKTAGARVILVTGRLLAFEQMDNEEGNPYAHIKLEARYRPELHSRYAGVLERTYEYLEPVDAPSPLPKIVADKLSEGLHVIAEEMVRDANSINLTSDAP